MQNCLFQIAEWHLPAPCCLPVKQGCMPVWPGSHPVRQSLRACIYFSLQYFLLLLPLAYNFFVCVLYYFFFIICCGCRSMLLTRLLSKCCSTWCLLPVPSPSLSFFFSVQVQLLGHLYGCTFLLFRFTKEAFKPQLTKKHFSLTCEHFSCFSSGAPLHMFDRNS